MAKTSAPTAAEAAGAAPQPTVTVTAPPAPQPTVTVTAPAPPQPTVTVPAPASASDREIAVQSASLGLAWGELPTSQQADLCYVFRTDPSRFMSVWQREMADAGGAIPTEVVVAFFDAVCPGLSGGSGNA